MLNYNHLLNSFGKFNGISYNHSARASRRLCKLQAGFRYSSFRFETQLLLRSLASRTRAKAIMLLLRPHVTTEQCQVHAGEEDHARPEWTTSGRGQDSPWKSQSE